MEGIFCIKTSYVFIHSIVCIVCIKTSCSIDTLQKRTSSIYRCPPKDFLAGALSIWVVAFVVTRGSGSFLLIPWLIASRFSIKNVRTPALDECFYS